MSELKAMILEYIKMRENEKKVKKREVKDLKMCDWVNRVP